ncbi:MAG: xanthine dehydrogenase family protein molybdopterin-binding subunit [Gammaproteobacteria bacterium]|nr:xanthine dehydrogenase family protein molybdopterin-binding subunit [Gammaproteobacteria bacterium]
MTSVHDSAADDTLPRRRFLVSVMVGASGALLLKEGVFAHEPTETAAAPAKKPAAGSPFAAYVEILEGGEVRIVSPQTEIGQGIFDTLAMIIADEMDADWDRVTVVLPHANLAFANPANQRQRIGGSDSIVAYREPLRQVGAAAREMLITAAATRWNVAPETLTTERSRVLHAASGRSIGFGELAADAAVLPVPAKPKLKDAAALRLTGRRHVRKDTPSKVDGSALFAVDVREPGMLFAALRRSQSLRGSLKSFNAASVSSRKGVVAVVPLEDAGSARLVLCRTQRLDSSHSCRRCEGHRVAARRDGFQPAAASTGRSRCRGSGAAAHRCQKNRRVLRGALSRTHDYGAAVLRCQSHGGFVPGVGRSAATGFRAPAGGATHQTAH